MPKQLLLFKPHDILTDDLLKVVARVRNSLKPTAKIIRFPSNKRQLLSCSNVRKQHGRSKHS